MSKTMSKARKLLARFAGTTGRAARRNSLLSHDLIQGDKALADAILRLSVDSAALRHYEPRQHLIVENEMDQTVFFILAGKTEVRVKGNIVAERAAGHHVGEMACIEPAAPRSADVIALEPTIVLALTASAFEAVALKHPIIWQRIARTLGRRLRERGARERQANALPHIFFGSSSERLPMLERMKKNLTRPSYVLRPWTSVFRPSRQTLDQLSEVAFRCDFAVLLLTKDDLTRSRHRDKASPRDNVLVELGLFIGRLSLERVFIVAEPGLKIPSDLDGLTRLNIQPRVRAGHRNSVDRVCAQICEHVDAMGVRFTPKEGERP